MASQTRAEPIVAARRSKPAPGLHVVATPIGNLADISERALESLRRADVIACEDTRVTAKLLNRYGIATPMIAYHEHNAKRVRPGIINRLKNGETVALVSDAGTPLVSDPGFRLVRDAIDAEIPVVAVPGASSVMAALVVSGLPSDRFFFAGFPPPKQGARRNFLAECAAVPSTLIFLESPRRLAGSLADMAAVLGGRGGAVARELTKLHEEIRRGSLADLARHYADAGAPKGEIVVVVGPPEASAAPEADDVDTALAGLLEKMSMRDAVDAVATSTGLKRKLVYARALEIAARGGSNE